MAFNKSHIRLTVVGDGNAGKTCMLIVFKDKKYEEYYIPTVFDSYSMDLSIAGRTHTVILADTAGQEEYDRLRPLAYPETDAFIMCFSLNNRDSYDNIITKWNPEIRHHKPTAKVILVGTKADLRSECKDPISTKEGEHLKSKIRADGYVECSSKYMWNVNKVFEEALISVVAKQRSKPERNCILL